MPPARAFHERMPCLPRDLHAVPYRLPGLFDRAEGEEAAIRILLLLHAENRWRGVTCEEIHTQVRYEIAVRRAQERAFTAELRQHAKDLLVAKEGRQRYAFWSVMTLGIYRRFATRPALPRQPELLPPAVVTGVFSRGSDFVARGLDQLIEEGLLLHRTVLDATHESRSVYYMTPTLVRKIRDCHSYWSRVIRRS